MENKEPTFDKDLVFKVVSIVFFLLIFGTCFCYGYYSSMEPSIYEVSKQSAFFYLAMWLVLVIILSFSLDGLYRINRVVK